MNSDGNATMGETEPGLVAPSRLVILRRGATWKKVEQCLPLSSKPTLDARTPVPLPSHHMDPICVRTASHDNTDRIRIASLTGAVQRLAYPLYRRFDTYNQDVAIGELHSISTDPHLLAHAIGSTTDFLHDAIKQLLLAAGANPLHLQAIADDIAARSPMPH